jgi:hypothetical protein
MLISHTLQLLPGGDNAQWEWLTINGVLILTKVATPLFIWVFGMTMAYVYTDQAQRAGSFLSLRRRVWRRALFVFLSYEVLVVVIEGARGSPVEVVLGRMLYVRTGHWVEVLNFYLVVLLISPWVLRAWVRAGLFLKVATVPVLYAAGVFLAEIPVHPTLRELKNVLAAYPSSEVQGIPPDTFPVLQLSSFYLLGLTFGGYVLRRTGDPPKPTTIRVCLVVGIASLCAAYLVAGGSFGEFIRDIIRDRYRFPPGLPYILLGLSGVLFATSLCLYVYELRKNQGLWTRALELLGRHSLFTFVVQYVLLFTIYGVVLKMWSTQGLAGSVLHALIVLAACTVLAWSWGIWKGRRRRLRA